MDSNLNNNTEFEFTEIRSNYSKFEHNIFKTISANYNNPDDRSYTVRYAKLNKPYTPDINIYLHINICNKYSDKDHQNITEFIQKCLNLQKTELNDSDPEFINYVDKLLKTDKWLKNYPEQPIKCYKITNYDIIH